MHRRANDCAKRAMQNVVTTSTESLSIALVQNYFSIIPTGPGAWWEEPHDRDEKFPSK